MERFNREHNTFVLCLFTLLVTCWLHVGYVIYSVVSLTGCGPSHPLGLFTPSHDEHRNYVSIACHFSLCGGQLCQLSHKQVSLVVSFLPPKYCDTKWVIVKWSLFFDPVTERISPWISDHACHFSQMCHKSQTITMINLLTSLEFLLKLTLPGYYKMLCYER